MPTQSFICGRYMSFDRLDLPDDTVHIWIVNLRRAVGFLEEFGKNITSSEQTRAKCLGNADDRERFLAAQGVLRDIMKRYVHQPPPQIELFSASPVLGPRSADSNINFSIATSCDLAAFAITRTRGVGLELERLRSLHGTDAQAERLISPPAPQEWRALSPPACREDDAFAQAALTALRSDWNALDAPASPAEEPPQTGEPDRRGCSIYPFQPALGYVGYLSYERIQPRLKFWKWLPLAPVGRLTEPPTARVSITSHALDLIPKEEAPV